MENNQQKKLKIAQVVCTVPPYGGGIGMVAHSYADQMAERGHEVTLFTGAKKTAKMDYKYSYEVKHLWTLFRVGHAAVLPQLVWRLRKYDIVHLHYPYFGAGIWTALAKIFYSRKQRLVVSYHMDIVAGGLLGIINGFYKNFVAGFVLKKADQVIGASESYLENSDIQQYYLQNSHKFSILPFGVPKKFFPSFKDEKLMEKYGIKKEDKVVLFVGGLDSAHYFKGVHFLIKAVSMLKDDNVKLLIVGQGNLKPQYEKQAENLNIRDKVIFTDYIETKDLPAHYNLADVFVLPSINKSEAFGIVLLEAMACGKTIVASNLNGVKSVVSRGTNGLLIEPKNSFDISQKIKCLFDDDEMRERYSRNAVKTVEEKYRWSVICDKLEKIYFKLVTKK